MSAAAKLNPQPSIRLVVQKGPHAGQRFSFAKGKITIGRSPENDIILVNDPLISRQHAYISISNNDVEIVNLSAKNSILVNNENVNKWKLTNDSIFTIGDTEFLIHIESHQSIVVVKPSSATVTSVVVPAAPVVASNGVALQPRSQPMAQPKVVPIVKAAPRPQTYSVPPVQSVGNQRLKVYGIVAVILAIGAYFLLSDSDAGIKKNKKSTLKYSDEMAIKINSKQAEELRSKQEKLARLRQTPSYIRAEENFIKGMRSFQQGTYTSSIDYFQQALNNQPEHLLAKRYLQLSLVRFDELVKLKLELGQSYFERNNFKLCQSMFQQVVDMLKSKESLQVQSKDTNLQLAETMSKKCEFAAEGIR
jgi:tetratricopeptide (TPR) repeat protein